MRSLFSRKLSKKNFPSIHWLLKNNRILASSNQILTRRIHPDFAVISDQSDSPISRMRHALGANKYLCHGIKPNTNKTRESQEPSFPSHFLILTIQFTLVLLSISAYSENRKKTPPIILAAIKPATNGEDLISTQTTCKVF